MIKPLTSSQEEVLKALNDDKYQIVGIFGPTGTGKTLLTLSYGIDVIKQGKFKKFIIVKPIVDIVTKKEITATELPNYHEVILSYIKDVLGPEYSTTVDELYKSGRIEILDSRLLRGRTFDDSIIFIDEVQELQPESIIELIIRIGRNSKLVVAGDPVFQSLQMKTIKDPSELVREVLLNEEDAKVIDLGVKDIIRAGAKRGLRLLIEYRLRSRMLSEEENKVLNVTKAHAPDADIITVVDLSEEKKKLGLDNLTTVPDSIIVVKEGNIGRLVGKGGERINSTEKEIGKKLRALELSLDFKEYIRAVHPLPWVVKHIEDADFKGNELVVQIKKETGAFMGQKGSYVRFVDEAIRKLLGVGIRVIAKENENS
ncbi:PhoH family protein [Sulfurisphaera ohwakuensis]|uniref:PhoH family protein n=1 Tax=Sulfurisphaera ohwakuensis TaxID=69656 RepID=A0A650CIP6_SULOH|nr:PhoH family protein [Sulfurisphaera ohwakuensis]MBB5254554.1 phosphate starvation-inducible protein PhoH [Sulfurisphaera ohwakuensis]QGR17608.1 PhoH family protein [Sulfurisphaera ohwakuensis]